MADVYVNGVKYFPARDDGWQRVCDEHDNPNVPDDERRVLVFLNGHVTFDEYLAKNLGGGHGVNLGRYDHEKRGWRVGTGLYQPVSHWMDLPQAPAIPAEVSP